METLIRQRLDELRLVTPQGAAPLMNAFEGVCDGYFNRGASFTEALLDAFMGHVFDRFMTDFDFEHAQKLPSVAMLRPELFDDIEAVFKGVDGELYPFNGMLNVELQTFRNAYLMLGGGSGASTISYENKYLETWTRTIERAEANEEARLRSIKEYAIRRYQPWSPPLLYDDLGRRHARWGNRGRELVGGIFEAKRWAWVFEAFDLRGRAPEYVREYL